MGCNGSSAGHEGERHRHPSSNGGGRINPCAQGSSKQYTDVETRVAVYDDALRPQFPSGAKAKKKRLPTYTLVGNIRIVQTLI